MKHTYLLIILSLLFLSACEALIIDEGAHQDGVVPDGETAVVTWVVDGDTVEVEFPDGRQERVRYIGINTPEWDERCGDEATKKNIELVKNETVILVPDLTDRDRFDRLLRYVYVGDRLINAELVAQGYAFARTYGDDDLNADLLYDLMDEAEEKKLGCLWGE